MSLPWEDRSTVVANLLNPAYLGAILRTSADEYCKTTDGEMPFELCFVVPALVLHPTTAARLPKSVATTLHSWIQSDENRDVLISLDQRISDLVPFVKEALIFAAQRQILALTDDGNVTPGTAKLTGITAFRALSEETKEHLRLGQFTGRWLASAGSTSTIYMLMGIKP